MQKTFFDKILNYYSSEGIIYENSKTSVNTAYTDDVVDYKNSLYGTYTSTSQHY